MVDWIVRSGYTAFNFRSSSHTGAGATDSYEDARPVADHSEPANKIPAKIRKEIINICNKPEYASMAPCEIVSALADEGVYIASESTFYRV